MHRKVKGLLSLILTLAMVTVTAAPASAEELSGEQQPAEEQSVVETAEIQTEIQTEIQIKTEPVKEQPTSQIELEVWNTTEQQPVEEQPSEESSVAETESAEPIMAETESAEPITEEAESELDLYSEPSLDDLYNGLTEEQKKFNVYSGNRPLSDVITGTNVLDELVFEATGVTPDASDLDSQSGGYVKTILEKREGDLKFYRLFEWKVWKVNSSGIPESVIASRSSLSKLATESNFKQAAYLANGETGTESAILFSKPILEPVWSCLDFAVPVYDSNGNNTGTTITVNAENYNDGSQVFFPDLEADFWKLVYNGTEYSLNTASEIWTNETNGIRTIGRDFDVSQARIQAGILPETQESKYEVSGEQGNEGWYIGAVTICAKEGYQVRLSQADEWSDAVSVAESGTVSLFLKKSDGTELPAETLSFLIDQTDPVIVGIQNGGTYYSDEVAVVVMDEYLHTVTLNGGAVGIIDNRVDIVLRPSVDPYIIAAEDMAGNWIECIVWVKESEVLQEGTAEFVQSGWYEGQPKPEPVVSSATNGVENITYYYKEAGADDSTYTTVVPEKVGKYTAKAVFAATEVYQEVIRTSDFEILPNIPVEEEDKTAPVISGVSNGQTCYGDQTVTVTDENLHTVTVNGEAVEVLNNHADIILKPSEDVYKIVASDKAGNETELTVEVLETWVRDGIITNGKKKLRRERLYKLGSGQWTIDGDSTVYSGGGTFYVKNSGEYHFKRK